MTVFLTIEGLRQSLAKLARSVGMVAGAAGIAATLTGAAGAQSWPEQPIALVVPYSAGGSTDTSARQLAEFLSEELGQPVVVENRPGANSIVGTTSVAQSAADGYTFLYTTIVAHAGNPAFYDDLPYDTFNDFAPTSVIQTRPNVLFAHESVPADTIEELVALARERPDEITFATNAPGSPGHLRALQMEQLGDIDLNLITYPGGAAARADLAGGNVDLYPGQIGTMESFVEEGQVKVIAALGETRLEDLPDVPSITETPGFESFNELASFPLILAPSGVTQEVIDGMYEAISKVVLENEEYRAMSEALREYPPSAATPDEAGEMLADYVDLIGSLAD